MQPKLLTRFDSMVIELTPNGPASELIVIPGNDLLSVKLPFDFIAQSISGDRTFPALRHEGPSLADKEWAVLAEIRPGLFELGPNGLRVWHAMAFALCAEQFRQYLCYYRPSSRQSRQYETWLADKHQTHGVRMPVKEVRALVRQLGSNPWPRNGQRFYLHLERQAVEFTIFEAEGAYPARLTWSFAQPDPG